MLSAELEIERFLELPEGRVLVTGNGDGGGLILCGVRLDLILQGVIIDIMNAPLRYGLLLEALAEFHLDNSGDNSGGNSISGWGVTSLVLVLP